jgi:hypothetical protein
VGNQRQFLFWVGKYRSIPPLRKALQLTGSNEPLLQVDSLNLLATEDASVVDEAIALLRRSSQ